MMSAHLGMWRSAVRAANLRPQWGQGTLGTGSSSSSSSRYVRGVPAGSGFQC
jgi:hypothetical protein